MSDSDSTSSLDSTSECSKPPSVIQNESSKDVSLSRSISPDILLSPPEVKVKDDDSLDDCDDDFMKYLLSLPCSPREPTCYTPSVHRPRTRVPQTPKVGLDHLNNLCKLMESLGELREQNNRLQKRVQYLEDQKVITKALFPSPIFFDDLMKPLTQHQSTSTDGLPRHTSAEGLVTAKVNKKVVSNKGGHLKLKKSLAAQRERSKSLGNEENNEDPNHVEEGDSNKSKETHKGSKWGKVKQAFQWDRSPDPHSQTHIPTSDTNKKYVLDGDLRMPKLHEETSTNYFSSDDSSDDFMEGLWEEKIRCGLFRDISDDGECNFLSVPQDPDVDRTVQPDRKLSIEGSEVEKKGTRTRWGKVKTMIRSRKDSVKKRCGKSEERQHDGDRGSGISVEISVPSEYEDGGESDSTPKIKINACDWEKFQEIHDCIMQEKDHYSEFSGKSQFEDFKDKEHPSQNESRNIVDISHSFPDSPPLNRRSKWTKVKKVFLNRSPEAKSVPNSPKHPSVFSYEIEDIKKYPRMHSDNAQEDPNIIVNPLTLSSRYHGGDWQKNLEEIQKNLSLDFNRKLQEWDKMKTRRTSTFGSNLQDELSHIHVSDEFAKKLQEWEKLRGLKSESVAPVVPVSYAQSALYDIPKNLPHQFTKKLQEWEKIKAGKLHHSIAQLSPKMDRKVTSGHKLKKLKPKDSSKVKQRDKEMQWLEKELLKIEREKQRLEREREKYLEREARLEKMREAIKQPKDTQEVFIRTSTGEFRFEGISQTFTRKLYEWEERKGIGPEASTIALLNPNCHSLKEAINESAPNSVIGRSKSEGSIADVINSSVHSQPSSLSLDTEIDSSSTSRTLLQKALRHSECRRPSNTFEQSKDATLASSATASCSKDVEDQASENFDEKWRQKQSKSPSKDSYSLLLDENLSLIDQLATKEFLCKKLENALGDISVKMHSMDRRRKKVLDEKTRLASEEREVSEIPRMEILSELDAQINHLEECGVALQLEKEHLEATFQEESAQQARLADHLVGNMEHLRQVHMLSQDQLLPETGASLLFSKLSDEHLTRLQEISSELLKQARVIQDSIEEKNRQVNFYHWEWMGNNLRLRTQLRRLQSHQKHGIKYRSWSSTECLEALPAQVEVELSPCFDIPEVPKLDTSAPEQLGKKVEELKTELRKLSMIKRDSFIVSEDMVCADGIVTNHVTNDPEVPQSCDETSMTSLNVTLVGTSNATSVGELSKGSSDKYTKSFIMLGDGREGDEIKPCHVIIPTTRRRFNHKGECLTNERNDPILPLNRPISGTCTRLSSSTSVIYAMPSPIPTTTVILSDPSPISSSDTGKEKFQFPAESTPDETIDTPFIDDEQIESPVPGTSPSSSRRVNSKETSPKVKLLVEQYNEKVIQKSSQPSSDPCGSPWNTPVSRRRHMGYSSVKTKAQKYQEKIQGTGPNVPSSLKPSLSLPASNVVKSGSVGMIPLRDTLSRLEIQKSHSSGGISPSSVSPSDVSTRKVLPSLQNTPPLTPHQTLTPNCNLLPISPPLRQNATHYMDLRRSSSSRARVMKLQKAREEFLSLSPGVPLSSPPTTPPVTKVSSSVAMRQKTLSVISSNSSGSASTETDDLNKSHTLERYDTDKITKSSSFSMLHSDQPFYKRLSSLCSLFRGSNSPSTSGLETPSATTPRSPSPFSFLSRLKRNKDSKYKATDSTVEELYRQSLYVNISDRSLGQMDHNGRKTTLTRVPSKSCPSSPNMGRRRPRGAGTKPKWLFRKNADKS